VRVTDPSPFGDVFRWTRFPVMSPRHGTDSRIPGPTGLPFIGDAPTLLRDPFGYVRAATKRYGDIFRVPVPGIDLVVINHPDLVPEVLDRSGNFTFLPWPKALSKVTGLGMPFISDAQKYAERRSLYAPMFGRRYLSNLAEDFVDEMAKRLAAWDDFADTGRVIDLEVELARVLVPVFLRNMFSTSFTDAEIDTFNRDAHIVLRSVGAPLVGRPPSPRVVSAWRRASKRIGALLDERSADPVKYTDLLQIMVDARMPDGSGINRRDRIADTMAMLGAGYDTVTAALSWMFALLPTNRSAQQQLYDEVDAVGGALPVAADLHKLVWARKCFDEAQRLQGGPFLPRVALQDCQVAGYRIPKGAMVGVSFTNLHRDPRWWANPEVFDPHHFDKDQVTARPNRAFIPFGAGLRQCVGMAMAYQNALLMTTIILQRYRITFPPAWKPQHQWTGTITIKGGVPCTITRR
jgi:cytochrome P450